jgi:O-antigen ligase
VGARVSNLLTRSLVRPSLERLADWIVVAIAVSLPWSTSVTWILGVAWWIAVIPTLNVSSLSRELRSPAGGLPVLLWFVAVLSMLWSEVPWAERLSGLNGFHKLLAIPVLLAQFRRSESGVYVLYGFLISCCLILIASAINSLLPPYVPSKTPGVPVRDSTPGVPVRDSIAQSTEFIVCAYALIGLAFDRLHARRWVLATGLGALAILFLANIFFVAISRTALVVGVLLLVLLGFRQYGWRGTLGALLVCVIVGPTVWMASPPLRERLVSLTKEIHAYRADNALSPSGIRLEMWTRSLSFIPAAPVVGHGSGSVEQLFRRTASGDGASAIITNNPHNQLISVAVQFGLVGTFILIAMWIAHLVQFCGRGLIGWIGFVVVAQNIVSSLFNSHLSDFFHGWLYVFGFGVCGGMALLQANRLDTSARGVVTVDRNQPVLDGSGKPPPR